MDIKGLRVVVLGLARSGVAAAKLLHQEGAEVIVNDGAPLEKVKNEVQELESLGIEVLVGGHPDTLLTEEVGLLVKNPGIRYQLPLIQKAQEMGIPIVTEVEVASWYTEAPLIGITGSNGKTTTTTLVGLMLKTAGKEPLVAGNIGRALADAILHAKKGQPIVTELSSFQLMGTHTFRPHIAALLNIYPAHLDYHGTLEEYIQAKQKLFANQTSDDYAILNWDQLTGRETASLTEGHVLFFSTQEPVENGLYVQDGKIFLSAPELGYGQSGNPEELLSVSSIALKGAHNLENILVAVAISLAAGASLSDIREVLLHFEGVEHRLEFVREVLGVRYYNDSKATNSEAASKALSTFAENVIWVAGGLDRGDSFESLEPFITGRVKAVVALGESRNKLISAAKKAGVHQLQVADTIEEAVRCASSLAAPGDIVLLSPACASWDMFTSFEERGSIFKTAVHTM